MHASVTGAAAQRRHCFSRIKLAVFIDGCFWHGCPEHYSRPRTNVSYWTDKIAGNVTRDHDTNIQLRNAGWHVLRIWEHIEPADAARAVAAAVDQQRALANARRAGR